jgi:hypothetical protein
MNDRLNQDETTPRRWLYLVALAAGVVSGFVVINDWYRYTGYHIGRGYTGYQLQQLGAALLFAIPVLLGLLAGIFRPERPARTGMLLAAVALAGGMPILREGAICILMLTPIYVVVVAVVAAITGAIVRSRRPRRPPGIFTIVLLLVPGAATWCETRLVRAPLPTVTIADSVVIDAPREAVWATMARLEMRFPDGPAGPIAAMLPRPRALEGDGVTPGSFRRVVFDNGSLLATVTRSDSPCRFDVDLSVQQSGHEFFDHWAELMDASFTFDALPGGRTRMTHATRYRPRLAARWYFEPLERFFASKVQGYLLEEFVRQRFVEPPAETSGLALADR